LSAAPQVALRIEGDNLLLFRTPGLRLRADTAVSLTGPLNAMLLEGTLAVSDSRFTRYYDLLSTFRGQPETVNGRGIRLFSFHEPPLRDLRFDLRIVAKNPFVIANNLLSGELRPDLRLSGTGEVPVLTGRIFVDAARLRLPSGRMVFKTGLIQFLPADPDRPVLDLVGTSRLLGYDVTMVVEGAYDAPAVTLSSSPPLSNEDLLMLVLTGTPPPVESGTIDQQRRALNVAVYIGQDLIERWFGNENGGSLDAVLERFDAEVGRDVTRKGDETLEAQFRLTDGFFRQGDTLYLTGEKDVFDYYNVGLRIVFRFK
jgi:translocation and assembly module TamB